MAAASCAVAPRRTPGSSGAWPARDEVARRAAVAWLAACALASLTVPPSFFPSPARSAPWWPCTPTSCSPSRAGPPPCRATTSSSSSSPLSPSPCCWSSAPTPPTAAGGRCAPVRPAPALPCPASFYCVRARVRYLSRVLEGGWRGAGPQAQTAHRCAPAQGLDLAAAGRCFAGAPSIWTLAQLRAQRAAHAAQLGAAGGGASGARVCAVVRRRRGRWRVEQRAGGVPLRARRLLTALAAGHGGHSVTASLWAAAGQHRKLLEAPPRCPAPAPCAQERRADHRRLRVPGAQGLLLAARGGAAAAGGAGLAEPLRQPAGQGANDHERRAEAVREGRGEGQVGRGAGRGAAVVMVMWREESVGGGLPFYCSDGC